MRCPRCKNYQTDDVATGDGKLDYILACIGCPWQVAVRELETWLKRFRGK